MSASPRYAKAHAKRVAEEYQRLGWTVVSEFRADEGQEPYEYLLKWDAEGEPPRFDWSKFGITHESLHSDPREEI